MAYDWDDADEPMVRSRRHRTPWWKKPLFVGTTAFILGLFFGAAISGDGRSGPAQEADVDEVVADPPAVAESLAEAAPPPEAQAPVEPAPPADPTPPPPPPPTEFEIAQFTGSAAQTTRPFQVNDGWEVRWDASGDIFQIFVHTEDGQINGVAANQQGPGTGAAFQPTGGSYYLQMNAIGDWTVTVVDLP